MKLTFSLIKKDNYEGISVNFKKTTLNFVTSNNIEINNQQIIEFLTMIAEEISANNFNPDEDIVTINQEELYNSEKLNDLYEFIFNLFKSFIDTYIQEQKEIEIKFNQQKNASEQKIKNNL